MAAEIERKFLLAGDQWKAQVRRSRSVRQGYLANGETISVRVRIYDDENAMLTLKSERTGIRRSEFEYPIPKADAEQMLLLAQGIIVAKTRHEVPASGLVWEIDVFEGENEGLVLAEIELDFSEQGFSRPSWLGEEVTEDDRYFNSSLSKLPFRRWTSGQRPLKSHAENR